MQSSDYERFRAVMVGMGKVYEREIDAPLLDAYWLALRAWSLIDFEAAAATLLSESKFMPRPADFTVLRQKAEPTAGEAWAAVFDGIGDCTPRAVRALEIVTAGRRLSMMNLETEVPHVQRRFFQVYDDLTDVDHAREALPQLPDLNTRTRIRHDGFRRLGAVTPQLEDRNEH